MTKLDIRKTETGERCTDGKNGFWTICNPASVFEPERPWRREVEREGEVCPSRRHGSKTSSIMITIQNTNNACLPFFSHVLFFFSSLVYTLTANRFRFFRAEEVRPCPLPVSLRFSFEVAEYVQKKNRIVLFFCLCVCLPFREIDSFLVIFLVLGLSISITFRSNEFLFLRGPRVCEQGKLMDGWRKTWLDTRTACLRCRGISITPSRRHTRMHATVLCYNRTAVPVHDAAFLDALSSCRCAVNSLSFLSFTSFFSDDGAILDLDSWPNSECERTVPFYPYPCPSRCKRKKRTRSVSVYSLSFLH